MALLREGEASARGARQACARSSGGARLCGQRACAASMDGCRLTPEPWRSRRMACSGVGRVVAALAQLVGAPRALETRLPASKELQNANRHI
jgi:hypothetical protein